MRTWRPSGARPARRSRRCPRDGLDPASAERRLKDHFGVATLDSFGSFDRAAISAAGSALFYIEKTQIGSRPVLNPPTRGQSGSALAIDAATRANLELTRTLSGERAGSLLATIDCTVTPGGARLLAERLAGPLTQAEIIRDRHDAVGFLVENSGLRESVRGILKRSPDLARALSRLGLGRGGPRDLACVRDGLFAARAARGATRHERAPERARRCRPRAAGVADGHCRHARGSACRRAAAAEARRRLRPARPRSRTSTSCASCSRIPAASSRRCSHATQRKPAAAPFGSSTTT